jgi:hypothetical protein
MKYTVRNNDTGEIVARGQDFPRSGVTETVRRDPSNTIPNCPADLKGPNGERYGWFAEIKTYATLASGQKYGDPEYGTPSMSTGQVSVTYPAAGLSQAEVDAKVIVLRSDRKSEASTEFGSRVAAGFVVAGIRFGMNATAFETLTQAKALLTETPGTPIKAVTSFGSRVNVTSAAQADAVITALRVEYNRLVGKEADLYDAIDTYDFSQLQALDVTSDSHWS